MVRVMALFVVRCRGVFDNRVIAKLDAQGVYRRTGGSPETPPSQRDLHQLLIEASDEEQAIHGARQAVRRAGAEATSYESHGELSED